MSHKYRAAIGRESPRPVSRRFTRQLEPRRVSRDYSGEKSVFCLLFHARKSRWPAGDKSPAGRNPRRPNAGLRFGKRSASETGFFLARYRAENRCRLIGRHTCTASMRRSQTFPKSAARLAANRMVHPPARRRAATAFFRREKGSKTRRSPAASGMRPAAPPTPPNRWSESPSSSCGRRAQISFPR